MSKKLISLALAVVMAFAMLAAPIYAASSDAVFSGLKLNKFRYYQSTEVFDSNVAMRGFSASQDGKYYFGGYCATSAGVVNGVVKFDAKTGDPIAKLATGSDLPKGIATDDRGNLYFALSNASYKDSISVVSADIEGMKETCRIEQNVGSGKVGNNGVAVEKVGDTYYLYVVVNYDFERLYRYNANDPKDLKLDTTFGNGGYLDLEVVTGVKGCEGQYVDVDSLGNIYLSVLLGKGGSKADSIIKMSADGKILKEGACPEAYQVSLCGEYIAAVTYAGANSCVYIFTADELQQVAKIEPSSGEHSNFTGCMFYQDKIVAADQSYNSTAGFWVVDGFKLPSATVPSTEVSSTEVPASPKTFDAGIIAAAAAVISLAGYAVSKKRS